MADKIPFWRKAGRILNAGQTRSLFLTGNIHDLFHHEDGEGTEDYIPLLNLLTQVWSLPQSIVVLYDLAGPIRFAQPEGKRRMREAWVRWRTGSAPDELAIKKMLATRAEAQDLDAEGEKFDDNLKQALGRPALALEVLKQFCMCSREMVDGKRLLGKNLVIVLENADFLFPESQTMTGLDRHRVSLAQDWFCDPDFMDGSDSVILITESRSLVDRRLSQLPQSLEVEIEAPDEEDRKGFIRWFNAQLPSSKKLKLWGSQAEFARLTAGLSIHALRQLLKASSYQGRRLEQEEVVAKVEEHIKSMLGDDIVEFKKPHHKLKDVVGFKSLKKFLRRELIPRFKSSGEDALPGAAVSGPIGSGKTFIFEAVASELDMVVLVLKGIRSQWYGQTDVVLERLNRVLNALSKVLIFVDEADTQFGGVGAETHSTERRLTGKIQAMMSDPRKRGKVLWLLMTARIHLLSPDIRRPGRVGDLIIPILDPQGGDRKEFLEWMTSPVVKGALDDEAFTRLEHATAGFFSASFAAMRSELQAHAHGKKLSVEEMLEIIEDHIPPSIGPTREYQELQALVNCTRRSLLPDPKISDIDRQAWLHRIRELEGQGVH